MKKRTHFALSRQILKDNDNDMGRAQKMLFCLGSIFPDTTPLCLIRPHKFNVTDKKSKRRLMRVLYKNSHKLSNSFRLGCLSHHMADYFTAPHNRIGVKGFCTDHRGYENRLDLFVKAKLQEVGAKSKHERINPLTFWQELKRKHEEYMIENQVEESFETDYKFIGEMIADLFQISTERTLPSMA